jgi:hypothetical protein
VLLTKYYSVEHIEKNEMGGICSTYGERRGVCMVLVEKPEGKRPLRKKGVDWRIILRWIFRKWDVEAWSGSIWLRLGIGDGHL